ncbi:MAG: hypothetical protein R3E39_24005 [Anaerolineae bacterium]
MTKFVDRLLNGVTMYRLVVYYLIFLLAVAIVLGALGILPYQPITLLFSVGFLVGVSAVANKVFAWAYQVPANTESVYISALILALILDPVGPSHNLWFVGWAAVLAMASKYMVALDKKHLFNPVALGVAIAALALDQAASWWVGSVPMLPFVLVGGLLIVLKIRRLELVAAFILSTLATVIGFSLLNHTNVMTAVQESFTASPLLFFAFVFVTEPLTTPPTRGLQIIYGALVGFLFAPQFHIGAFYLTPELAMLGGNLFSYLVSPKAKLVLQLKEKIRISPDVYDFTFALSRPLAFQPGQYMEWTLGHKDADSRGNRRYFTLASTPDDRDLRMGVKFYPQSSSYKTALLNMDVNDTIVAGQLAGDFVLDSDTKRKVIMIAGGIGVTPFRSMIKHMLDNRRRRPATLLYANRRVEDILYRDVFDAAQKEIGLKVVYTLTDETGVPKGWRGQVGHIDRHMILETVPDYKYCTFYISGTNTMVHEVKDVLLSLGVKRSHIKTDYFPGLA